MGVYEECSRSRRSGTNDADVLRLATTRYQDDGNQGKVPMDLWRILSRSPKWQQLNNPDGGLFRKRSTVDAEVEVDETIGSTDQIPSFNIAASDDEDPIPRPIGRKKAKSIASGSGGSASVFASPRDEIGRAMIEQLRAFNLQEQERLKLKEKELKLKEQEAEMKVMQTDPGTARKNRISSTKQRENSAADRSTATKPVKPTTMAMPVDFGDSAASGGGGTLSGLYQNSRRLLLKTRDGLEKLERSQYASSSALFTSSSIASSSGVESPSHLFDSVRKDITQIQLLCSEMDSLWRSIPAKSQRDLWKRKVEQVAEEADSLKDCLNKYDLRDRKRIQEAQERAELLGRANGSSSHILRIFDEEAQAMQSIRRSSKMMEETFATGAAILSKYSEQRDRLKHAQRKALDVLNTMGLSNSVLRLIERRNRVDKWIKYTGMVVSVVILVIVWKWTR
ncbi:unnamed protein product [Cuscuta campestris]|uniref:No apical meristem-associated C-terminal domain-containing protein n=1 Tax=Cuscuta campestris TaxID=132261 RepID=A0A484L427_9ASTE|nr:unnamed protein product [Cuscuta campestris]